MDDKSSMEDFDRLLNFNRSSALEKVGGDEALLKEVAQLYLLEYPELLAEIRAGVRSGDPDLVHRAAHELKGTLGTLGAERAARLALQLESMGRARSLKGCETALAALQAALGTLRGELEAV